MAGMAFACGGSGAHTREDGGTDGAAAADGRGSDGGVGGRWTPQVEMARVFARGGYDFTAPRWLRVAADGSIFMAGPLSGEMAFYRTSLSDVSVVSAGYAAFLVKLAADGTLQWARGYASAAFSDVYDWRPPALMPDGSILLCGAHGPQHGDAAYVQRIGPDGQPVWLTEMVQGGPRPRAVAATPDGNVVAVGYYFMNDDVDPGPAVVMPTEDGQFVMRLAGANGAIASIVRSHEGGWLRPTAVIVPDDGFAVVGGADPLASGGLASPTTLVRLDANDERTGPESWLQTLAPFIGVFAPLEPGGIVTLTQNSYAHTLSILDRATGLSTVDQPVGANYWDLAARAGRIVTVGQPLPNTFDLDPGPGVDGFGASEGLTRWTADGAYAGSIGMPDLLAAQSIALDDQGATYVACQMALSANQQAPLGPGTAAPTFTAPAQDWYFSLLKLAP